MLIQRVSSERNRHVYMAGEARPSQLEAAQAFSESWPLHTHSALLSHLEKFQEQGKSK